MSENKTNSIDQKKTTTYESTSRIDIKNLKYS